MHAGDVLILNFVDCSSRTQTEPFDALRSVKLNLTSSASVHVKIATLFVSYFVPTPLLRPPPPIFFEDLSS